MFIHGPRCLLDLELTLTRLVVVACTLLAQVVPRLGHWDEVVMLDEDDVALREARRPSHLRGRAPQSARGAGTSPIRVFPVALGAARLVLPDHMFSRRQFSLAGALHLLLLQQGAGAAPAAAPDRH